MNLPIQHMHCSEVEATDEHPSAIDFHEIVDRDEDYDQQHSTQMFAGMLIESLPFRVGILAAILINSVVIGLQTNKQLVRVLLYSPVGLNYSGINEATQ